MTCSLTVELYKHQPRVSETCQYIFTVLPFFSVQNSPFASVLTVFMARLGIEERCHIKFVTLIKILKSNAQPQRTAKLGNFFPHRSGQNLIYQERVEGMNFLPVNMSKRILFETFFDLIGIYKFYYIFKITLISYTFIQYTTRIF